MAIINEDKKIVAQWIVFRMKKRWTLRQAAMIIGVDQSNLHKVEALKLKPSKNMKAKMALAILTRSDIFIT